MPSTMTQALRACGRTLPTAKTLSVVGPSSSASRALTRRAFLIAPSYKARVAARAYTTATATATKKAPTTRRARITPADAKPKKAAAKKAKAKPKAKKATKKVAKKKVVRAKKPLTPEKKATLEKRELKKVGLLYGEPKQETGSVWTTYVAERIKNENVDGPNKNFGEVMTRLAADFKSVSASEKSVSSFLVHPTILKYVLSLTMFYSGSSRRLCRIGPPMLPTTRSGWRATLLRRFTRRILRVIVSPNCTTSRLARSSTSACLSDQSRHSLTTSSLGRAASMKARPWLRLSRTSAPRGSPYRPLTRSLSRI